MLQPPICQIFQHSKLSPLSARPLGPLQVVAGLPGMILP